MVRDARLRLACLAVAGTCLIAAVVRLGSASLPLVAPSSMTSHLSCTGLRCEVLTDPVRLLGDVRSISAREITGAAQKLTARLARREVRVALFAAEMARALPVAALYLFLALALRRFAAGDPFGLRAVRWLRRAALAAGAAVLGQPVEASLRSTALEPAFTGNGGLRLSVSGDEVLGGLFLAAVVWVAAWALEEGRRTQAELAQIV